jgi:acetolactate synthase-1/2/3 large subunit
MAVSGGEVLLDVFKMHGIEYIFSSPGSEWFPVWEALAKRYSQGDRTLKYINCRHEVLAISMAFAYTKVTGRLPAVLLHAGVGTLNCAMAIRIAYRLEAPMIICAGDTSGFGEDKYDRGDSWKWVGALAEMGGTDALVRTYVKWSNAVSSVETLAGSLSHGCHLAQTIPKGPVFLCIPWEFLFIEQPEGKIRSVPVTLPHTVPDPSLLEEAAKLLMASKEPIVLTEHVGEDPEAVQKLVELAQLLSIPVFEYIYPRFANFPRDHYLHMGYDASEAIKQSDAIFVVGGTTPWQPPSAFPKNQAKVVLLDEDPLKERLPYWGYHVDLWISGHIGSSLASLVDIVQTSMKKPDPHHRERLSRWRLKHEQLKKKWEQEALAGKTRKPISVKWFLYIADRLLPNNSFILAETATHSELAQRYMARPSSFIKVISGGLGMGMGEAAGVKLAYPDRPVVLLIGDGSLSYNPALAGLGLFEEYRLPILTIVLNNGCYASMRSVHRKYYPDGCAVTKNIYFGVDLVPEPDYTKVGEAFHAYSERLEDPEEIEPAIERALRQIANGKSALLDVILDPQEDGGYASIGTKRDEAVS